MRFLSSYFYQGNLRASREARREVFFLCWIAEWVRHGKKNGPFDRPYNDNQGHGEDR